jgi:hypothetical protein
MLARLLPLSPATAPTRALDDLMHTLMAQAQRRGDLAQRGAAQVQPADRAMEIGSGALRLTLGLDQPPLCAFRRIR